MKVFLLIPILIFVTGFLHVDARKNVLFIVADDLRPQLGIYDGPHFPSPIHPRMKTPNLDHLASQSLVLTRAYVQQAVCSPSRTSFLTSRRPDTTHVYDLKSYFRKVGGNFTTLPQYFKEHGYQSIGMGKVFHPGAASGDDDPISWTSPYYRPPNKPYWSNTTYSWYAATRAERRKHPLPDEQTLFHAIKNLRSIAANSTSREKSFFMAVGFYKPHLPFIFPEEFLNFYPVDDIRLPPNPYAPHNMPEIAWSSYGELRGFHDIAHTRASGVINTTLPDHITRQLRRAYYSSVSYIDQLVGMLLVELRQLGLAENTIVSFIGDHGWHLGENGEWTKHTNFEQAVHAPMMIRIPGITDHGIISDELVEFVDLYPTIVEAASLPKLPVCPNESAGVRSCTEGTSMMPLTAGVYMQWKQEALSQWLRQGYMGYSLRTTRYRYTEWARFRGYPIYKPEWSDLAGVELYDHQIDPEENNNVADDLRYSAIRTQLSYKLHRRLNYLD